LKENNKHIDNEIPLLSICCLVYNHELYLKEMLDSILNQQTNFSYEILIHDDASTDNTAKIIKEYNKKHPTIFNSLLQTTNQKSIYKSGMNPRFNFPRARGKYIAICEGDDYWIDPLKLQKQVDFLEENLDFNICFTRTYLLKNGKKEIHKIPENLSGIFSFDDLLHHGNFIATTSVMFRNNWDRMPEWFNRLPYGDMAIYLIVSKVEKIKCLNDITAVYRIHKKGAWHSQNLTKKIKDRLLFNQIIYPQLNIEQKKIVKQKQKHWITKLSKMQSNRLKFLLNYYYLNKYKLK